jgi:putative ABC transport system permease protein
MSRMASSSSTQARPAQPRATFGRRSYGVWSLGILFGLLRVVGRRLLSHLSLMLAIAAGFVVAIALVVRIPVYA